MALGAFTLAYVPFVIVDAQASFVDWQLLRAGAAPMPHLVPEALVRSLLAPVVQTSHMEKVTDLAAVASGWEALAICSTGVAAIVLVALGAITQFPGKHLSLVALAGLPVFFFLTGRGYFEHYTLSVVPFLCLPAGAGAGRLLTSSWPKKWACATYLGFYVLVGSALLVVRGSEGRLDSWHPWQGMNVGWQIEQARTALLRSPLPSGPGDELAFARWVVAKQMLDRELRFAVGRVTCTPEIRLSGLAPPIWNQTGARLVPLANNSVFVCPAL